VNLSVVVPAWNEADSLSELFAEIRAALSDWEGEWEVIVVDDGSTDGTFEVVRAEHAKDSRIHGVKFRRNAGKAAGLAAGFAAAKGAYIITMDADLQDDPQELKPLMALLDQGWDMVSGWKQIRNDPVDKTLPSRFYNALVQRVSGLKLHDFNCGLKAYKREVLPNLRLYGQMHRLLPVMAHWDGFKVTEKVVNHRARRFGVSKYGWMRGFHGLFDLLTLWFLNRYMRRPLHLFGSIGLIAIVLGSLPIPWFALQWILTGDMHVRPLLLFSVGGIILGVQFLSLGLLAELMHSREQVPEAPVAERL
jgi:glycosyltransferase involved in cell wall biosynthesis